MLLAEHADLHVACLKWPRTTGPQAQSTWMLLVGHASDKDANPWNLFEPELICEANPNFADDTRSAIDFGSSSELPISGVLLRLRRGSWLALARTALRMTQLKIAAGDISSEAPVDFDIGDQGILSHQKLTKAEIGTNAKIATSAGLEDLTGTAACSIRIGLRQIPTSRQANAKPISFKATSCMLLGHASAQYWDKPAADLDGVAGRVKTSSANGMKPTALNWFQELHQQLVVVDLTSHCCKELADGIAPLITKTKNGIESTPEVRILQSRLVVRVSARSRTSGPDDPGALNRRRKGNSSSKATDHGNP